MEVRARLRGTDKVEIAVCDHGRGISADHLKQIFDPFFTTRMGRGGTGLGLGICHNIVSEALAGTIKVDSREGDGTTVIMVLPLTAPVSTSDTSP